MRKKKTVIVRTDDSLRQRTVGAGRQIAHVETEDVCQCLQLSRIRDEGAVSVKYVRPASAREDDVAFGQGS